jgi:hypothetical protein
MAADDKGLVLRGFFLLAVIGVIVTVVMTILFMRPQPAPSRVAIAPENLVPLLVAGYPEGTPYGTAFAMADRLPSAPGWTIRYNAATTLARRGSASMPWPLMREMLDESQQMRNARTRLPDGTSVIDEAVARANMVGALKALAVWHEKQGAKREAPAELREIYKVVDKLAESSTVELKSQAEKARATFFR